jgi:organic radical activating enzyme
MTTPFRIAGCVLWLACCLLPFSWGQSRREPLNPVEIDQLRDAAQEPEARIKLYLQFARTRLVALEQMRADPKVTDRAQQTHDKLQNFLDVYDELDDNIDTFVDRRADLRKPLKAVIEADTEFQAKLRALKSSLDASPSEAEKYRFLLDSVVDTVDDGVQDHRQLLAEQEEAAKHKRKPGS